MEPRFLGAFDEFAGLEAGTDADEARRGGGALTARQRDLRGLNELEGHGQPSRLVNRVPW